MLRILVPAQSSLPRAGRRSGTHTSSAPCRATAPLALVGCPLSKHPPGLFAFIRGVGKCKDFMRAITNKASQGMIPSQGLCLQFRWLYFFLCLQLLLVNTLNQSCFFLFCSVWKAYFEFSAGIFFMVFYSSPSVAATDKANV